MRPSAPMQLSTRASIEIPRPPEAVFDAATDHTRLHTVMKRTGPIPGVLSVEMEKGATPGVGATRSVKMSDGSTMREEITVHDRGKAHRYRWLNPPAAPFSLMVRGAESDWSFRPSGGGTVIDWTYTFDLTSPLVYPLAAPVIWLFNRWMKAALGELRKA